MIKIEEDLIRQRNQKDHFNDYEKQYLKPDE